MNLLNHGFRIRPAQESDLSVIVSLIRQQEKMRSGCLGKPQIASLRQSIQENRIHVGVFGSEEVVGFVEFYRRKDGVQTVYALAADRKFEGLGVGRNLLYSVPTPIQLKCPQFVNGDQPNPANQFYQKSGMKLIGYARSRSGKLLNLYQLSILPILVQGNNRAMPEIARQSGWAYGSRAAEIPRDFPFQFDLEFDENWRDFDWDDYMHKICTYHPVAALALDYFEPEQKATMLSQIEDLKYAGVMRILVCPKFHGAVKDIPSDCTVAVSVPSSYAGFVPDFSELVGRKVHLLGGTPPKWFGSHRYNRVQIGLIPSLLNTGIQIVSVDGNSHTRMAKKALIWKQNAWKRHSKHMDQPVDFHQLCIESGKNILSDLHYSHIRQLSLF